MSEPQGVRLTGHHEHFMAPNEPDFADDNDRIAWFFEAPSTNPTQHARNKAVSVLYLLRRELIETLGYDPNANTEDDVDTRGSRNRLFASAILMFTAIDLLAKYMSGDVGGIGDRFKRFLQSPDSGGLAPGEAELLWAVRNSLVHAFGLPDSGQLTRTGHRAVGIGQRQATTSGGFTGLVVIAHRGDDAVVYVDGLFRVIKHAIANYQETLYGSGSAQARTAFASAFASYGWIRVMNEA